MSEENEVNMESGAIDPPGTTGTEASASLDTALSADGDGAIDPPGTTE